MATSLAEEMNAYSEMIVEAEEILNSVLPQLKRNTVILEGLLTIGESGEAVRLLCVGAKYLYDSFTGEVICHKDDLVGYPFLVSETFLPYRNMIGKEIPATYFNEAGVAEEGEFRVSLWD